MKKKPEEEIVEEPKAPKDSMVSVEMTEDQAKKFAKFVADEEDKVPEAPKEPEKIFRLQCLYEHNLNGRKFGPGVADIPECYLAQVQVQEQRAREHELNLNQSKTRLFKIMQSGQSIPMLVKQGQQLTMPGEVR